jgi:hypothetical protein
MRAGVERILRKRISAISAAKMINT